MRDPKRIKRILQRLEALWVAYPDLRLGQLLLNLGAGSGDIYNTEDDELMDEAEVLYFGTAKKDGDK